MGVRIKSRAGGYLFAFAPVLDVPGAFFLVVFFEDVLLATFRLAAVFRDVFAFVVDRLLVANSYPPFLL